MKKNYPPIKKRAHLVFFQLIFLFSLQLNSQIIQTFSYTGSTQTFVVPSCVSTITMEAWGAQGGANWVNNTNYGGYAKGTFTVTPGATYTIWVGQQPNGITGGFNGGGNGESLGQGGGGASDVRVGGNAYTNRIIVAGGGGGGGYWTGLHVVGGVGGGLVGGDGYRNTTVDAGGQGGTQTGSGLGTCSTFNNPSVAGGLGFGGSPTGCGCEGYGGGGGYYGGAGSGNCRGGGGGSGYLLPSATNTVFTSGITIGHGKVVFSYNTNGSGVIASATSSSFCAGTTQTLSVSNVLTYTWMPGGSNATSLVVSPTSSTSYTVQGTNNLGCISTAVLNLTVDPGVPTLSVVNTASASGGICPTKTVVLTASGATSYTWVGGSVPVTNGVVFSPVIPADYTVTGGNACGTNSAVTSVSVHPPPTITISASSSSICSGSSVTLTATGNGTNYALSGHTSAITNGVGFSPVLTATYTVTGTSALSCTASAIIPVTVVATPVIPPIASPILICIGGSSTLTAQGATNYTWTSSSQTVYTSSLIATPSTTGISTYTVTKANSNCVDTKIISVTTNPLPTVFAIVTPTLVCALNPATLAVGGGQSYTWTASTSTNSFVGPSPVVYPPSPTIYTVAASDGTCISTVTLALAVDPNPTILTTAVTSSAICLGQSVTVNATGGNNYTVTSTSGGNFNTASVTESPTVTTAYTFTGDNSFGCNSSATQVIVVNPNPTLSVVANKTLVCSGAPATLTVSGANTYTWTSNNASTNTTAVNPTNLMSGPVIYTAMGSYTTGCTSSKTIAINVFVPVLTVSGNTNTCAGGLITLAAGGGNNGTYSWNTGSGTSNFQTLTTTLSAAAVFTLSASSTSITANCPATKTIAVGIYANPIITAVAQRTIICVKEFVELHGEGGVSYVWNTSANTQTIIVAPLIQTNYTVTGTDANGCVSTGVVQIKVSSCVGINEKNSNENSFLVYPNPNTGDFVIQSTRAMNLNLVNELGQVIQKIQLSGETDYKVSVNNLAKGIYFIAGQKDNLTIYQKVIVTK